MVEPQLIIRNDDVSANSDLLEVSEMYSIIQNLFPGTKIWSGVTVFAKRSKNKAIYPDLPIKNKSLEYLFNVNAMIHPMISIYSECVSHGLWHIDHSKAGVELQKASILSSCSFLKTNIFVPPFNRFNENTEIICQDNNIQLVKSDEEGWKSFEHNEFNPAFKKWYFHSWRWTPKKLKEYLQEFHVNVNR